MVRIFLAGILFLAVIATPIRVMADDTGQFAGLNDPTPQTSDDHSLFDEPEPVISASPANAISYPLPPGTSVDDFEVSPAGTEVALIIDDRARHQQLAFWQFSSQRFARVEDVPAGIRVSSLTWHPQGKFIFLLGSAASQSEILRIDPANSRFDSVIIFKSSKPLRRLVVGPRPFGVPGEGRLVFRLFFGQKLANGHFTLRAVTERGTVPYTVVGPDTDPGDYKRSDGYGPATTDASSALPVEFHPAGNLLIWEDEKKCLFKTHYDSDNWGKTEPLGDHCGSIIGYTPNGAATIEWQSKTPGLHVHGLIDGTDRTVLRDYVLNSVPSQMPDGKGVVALTNDAGATTLRYLPITVPLADVVNAWMYLDNSDDQDRFVRDRGLFRNLADEDQIYQLYDSESYTCGEPDSSIPTRPYYVTTDLFWEVYGAAFDGLFIVIERERAMPAFRRLVDAATAGLQNNGTDNRLAKAFAAAQAVLENGEDGNPEAQAIIAAKGLGASAVLGEMVDYAQFRPRGHYKTDDQKRYFGAMRYLSLIKLSDSEVAQLRALDPSVAKAANEWLASYRPFIAASRLDLVWDADAPKSPISSHRWSPGTRMFPLSWAWDNEALDNVIAHSDWPAEEQVSGRTLPSGLDFAAIAGNTAANQLMGQAGLFAQYPNLAARIAATHRRFAAAPRRDAGTLYEKWIAGLATQWADDAAAPGVSGALWDVKRLQTGLSSWATLRHSTILVNDQSAAECGEGGFENIVMRPPRGYVEPDPVTFAAIANLFDATIDVVRANPVIPRNPVNDAQLREGIVRRLTQSRDDTRHYQQIAEKELAGQSLSSSDYQSIQYVGGAVEHNFLVFMSLSNPDYALSVPDPMMKIADVAGAGAGFGSLEAAVGRPLEWDQIVPYYGRQEIVKGAIYSYYEFAAPEPIDDERWQGSVDTQQRPTWVARYLARQKLDCPAREP